MSLRRYPAGAAPPPIRWWGNAFVRVWRDRQQLVVVLRLPWWGRAYDIRRDEFFRAQLCVSWRHREGWRTGWRFA